MDSAIAALQLEHPADCDSTLKMEIAIAIDEKASLAKGLEAVLVSVFDLGEEPLHCKGVQLYRKVLVKDGQWTTIASYHSKLQEPGAFTPQ